MASTNRTAGIAVGDRFGRLTVTSGPYRKVRGEYGHTVVPCSCECGGTTEVRSLNLLKGTTVSCGCYRRERERTRNVTHGMSKTRLHAIWTNMKQRCYTPGNAAYPRYGGKGVTVCDAWRESFEAFRDWAHANGYDDHLTIERVNGDGHYEPGNCKWATYAEQGRNRKITVRLTAFGESKTLQEWSDDPRCSVGYDCLKQRVHRGWEHQRIIVTPQLSPGPIRRKS